MRLSKFSKKWIAYICAIAMVVTSLAFVPSSDAVAEDYSNLEFKVSDNNPDIAVAFVTQGGITTSQEVNYCLDQGTNFYCATTAAFTKPNFKTVTCNGNVEDPARAGANFWVPMSILNDDAYNVVVVEDAVGNTSQFVIRMGTPEDPTEESTEAPSEEPSTEAPTEAPSVEPTTEAPTEAPSEETTEAPSEETTEAPSGDWLSAKNQWVLRKDDGSFDVIADGGATYDGFDGIASFYSGSWGNGDVDVKTPASTDPNKLDIRVNSAGTGDWSMQVHINKTGLDATKAYSVTLTVGETTLLEETISEVSTYAKTVNLANKLAVGETTLVLDIEEQTMPPAPVVQDITITPNEAQIETNRNIWASWTNPTDTTKAYAYLKQADAGYDVIAANGWDFNTQATQPMIAVDNVDHSKNNEVKVEEGGTYVFIVDTYDAWNRPTGHGEVEITIPSLTPEEKEAKEYLEKINTEENLALHKTPIVA
ncbi:MAG: hypothetical protein IJ883_05790 [Eubacterium sp.]|nr:hypothetical protein [Eubacterium sp.]